MPTQPSVENLHINYSQPSIYTVPQYLLFFSIHISLSAYSTNHRSGNTTVFTIEKNSRISRSTQVQTCVVQGSNVYILGKYKTGNAEEDIT